MKQRCTYNGAGIMQGGSSKHPRPFDGVIRDKSVANGIPEVTWQDGRACMTHEAATGTVDRKELQTLMSRGLDEEIAVDVIIRGMLRQAQPRADQRLAPVCR